MFNDSHEESEESVFLEALCSLYHRRRNLDLYAGNCAETSTPNDPAPSCPVAKLPSPRHKCKAWLEKEFWRTTWFKSFLKTLDSSLTDETLPPHISEPESSPRDTTSSSRRERFTNRGDGDGPESQGEDEVQSYTPPSKSPHRLSRSVSPSPSDNRVRTSSSPHPKRKHKKKKKQDITSYEATLLRARNRLLRSRAEKLKQETEQKKLETNKSTTSNKSSGNYRGDGKHTEEDNSVLAAESEFERNRNRIMSQLASKGAPFGPSISTSRNHKKSRFLIDTPVVPPEKVCDSAPAAKTTNRRDTPNTTASSVSSTACKTNGVTTELRKSNCMINPHSSPSNPEGIPSNKSSHTNKLVKHSRHVDKTLRLDSSSRTNSETFRNTIKKNIIVGKSISATRKPEIVTKDKNAFPRSPIVDAKSEKPSESVKCNTWKRDPNSKVVALLPKPTRLRPFRPTSPKLPSLFQKWAKISSTPVPQVNTWKQVTKSSSVIPNGTALPKKGKGASSVTTLLRPSSRFRPPARHGGPRPSSTKLSTKISSVYSL